MHKLIDLEAKILDETLADTVAEVEVEKLGNTAGHVETEEVFEMQADKLAS